MAEWMRTAILIVTLGISAAVGALGADWLVGSRGGLGPTILQSIDPVRASLAILLVLAIATILGLFVGKVSSAASGMFVVGFALFAMVMRTQGVTEFIFSEGNTTLLIVEALGLSLFLLICSISMFRISGPLEDVPLNESEKWDAPFSPRSIGMTLLISLAMLPVIWLVAVTPSKGQVIGAAAVGGIVVACLARKWTPNLQPLILFAAPTAIAAVGYAIATSMGVTDIAFTQNTISPFIFPMPLEYAAGSLMGIPIGLSWGASLAKNETWVEVTKV